MSELSQRDKLRRVYSKNFENEKIFEGNVLLWTENLDNCLKDYVIRYNFNFHQISEKFKKLIDTPISRDFTFEEIRLHWSFLNSARGLKIKINEDYYINLRKNNINYKKKYLYDTYYELYENYDQYYNNSILKQKEKLELDAKYNFVATNNKTVTIEKIVLDNEKKEEIKEKSNNNGDITIVNDVEKSEKLINDKSNDVIVNKEEELTEINEEVPLEANEKLMEDPTIEHIDNQNKIEGEFDKEENIQFNKINIYKDDATKYEALYQNNFEEDDLIESLFRNPNKQGNENRLNTENFETNENKTGAQLQSDNFPIQENNFKEKDNQSIKSDINVNDSSFEHQNDNRNIEDFPTELQKTKNMDDFIMENPELKRQYDNLNKYYDFAMKSIKYFVPKFTKNSGDPNQEAPIHEDQEDKLESNFIQRTTERIHNLIAEAVNTNSINHSEAEEEYLANSQSYNPILDAALTEEQKDRMNKFRNFLSKDTESLSTQDLLQNIANVIQNTYTEEIEKRNDEESKLTETNQNQNTTHQGNETVQNKKQYQYYYRGVLCTSDKPRDEEKNSDSELSD